MIGTRYLLLLMLFSQHIIAQSNDTIPFNSKKVKIGVEQDLLPYVLGGFIGTAWIGKNHTRVRLSYAEANIPSLLVQDGFKKDRTHAFGISYEYFFKDDFKGLWFGPGIGYWNNQVTTSNGIHGSIKSYVFSIGGGYNIFLWKGLYTTPWLALHTRIVGNNSRMIDNFIYKPMLFTPEVSVKLGWKF